MHKYSEDILVEQPTIDLFAELGYETANTFHEKLGKNGTFGRETYNEVVLVRRVRAALQHLNPGLPYEAIELAIEELTRDRSALSPANANREIYQLLKQGIPVRISASEDAELVEVVRVINWNDPYNNDFFLASQFWISGEMYRKRADLVGFVNGLPLIFIELKTAHKRVEDAFHDNLRDYKDTIPQIFWYNAFIILSNGHQSRIGSMTSGGILAYAGQRQKLFDGLLLSEGAAQDPWQLDVSHRHRSPGAGRSDL
jgi:type I restriction enzyme R subunit